MRPDITAPLVVVISLTTALTSIPLGAFWLGLSLGSVGVHGTNAPLSIFRHVTHGCVRMHPDDIARLYPLVPLGARGRIVYEPILLAKTPEGIFLEVHPDVYRRMTSDALSLVRETAATAGVSADIDWAEAAKVLQARRGNATHVDLAHGGLLKSNGGDSPRTTGTSALR